MVCKTDLLQGNILVKVNFEKDFTLLIITWDFFLNFQTAIVIPYRKREEQLKIYLKHMHPILQRQQLHYRIFVIEQVTIHSYCLYWRTVNNIIYIKCKFLPTKFSILPIARNNFWAGVTPPTCLVSFLLFLLYKLSKQWAMPAFA